MVFYTSSANCFNYNITIYSSSSCGLLYYIYEPEFPISTQIEIRYCMKENEDIYYTTFPSFYIQKFYSVGQTEGNNVSCTENSYSFWYKDTSHYFYVPSSSINNFLNINTLELSNNYNGTCRLPDIDPNNNNGIVFLHQGQNNLLSSGSTYDISKMLIYIMKILNIVQDILKNILNVLKMI